MRTTHIVRGEEWLSSVPIHLQLFDVLGFERPQYAHISTLMKMDGTSKRKLSKRKDPELAFSYYEEQGYLPKAVIEYLFRIINSDFEEWRINNPLKPYTSFLIEVEKMSAAGALFDLNKLMDISKDIIAYMSAAEVYSSYVRWAEKYDKEIAQLLEKDQEYGIQIFNIEREGKNSRKDISKWSDVRDYLYFFFDELYFAVDRKFDFPESLSREDIAEILEKYALHFDENVDKEHWFEQLKLFSERLGYSGNVKSYRKNPGLYKGHVGDVAMTLRIALTKKTNTPDLYEIIKVMGKRKLQERLKSAW